METKYKMQFIAIIKVRIDDGCKFLVDIDVEYGFIIIYNGFIILIFTLRLSYILLCVKLFNNIIQ